MIGNVYMEWKNENKRDNLGCAKIDSKKEGERERSEISLCFVDDVFFTEISNRQQAYKIRAQPWLIDVIGTMFYHYVINDASIA